MKEEEGDSKSRKPNLLCFLILSCQQDWGIPLWATCSNPYPTLCLKKKKKKSKLLQFETVTLCPIATDLDEKSLTIFPIIPIYILEVHMKVSPWLVFSLD